MTARADHLDAFESWSVLANLPAAKRRSILHILACEVCRAAALGQVASPADGACDGARPRPSGIPTCRARREPVEMPCSGMWSRGGSTRVRPSVWSKSSCESPRGDALQRSRRSRVRLRPLQAAEGLLRAADLRLAAAPREAEQLAHVAFRLLERVDPEDHPRARLVEVRVARWCVAAGARVLLGDDAGAERAFQQALGELTADADATARARYCRGLAGFRLSQCRHDEALGLLLRAAQLYEDAGETALEAATQLDRGCALAEVAELESAIAAFHCALRGLDPDRDAIQSIRAHQGIGSCYAELKLDAEAAAALAAGRALYPRLADPRQRLQAEWLEARVLARAGELAWPAALLAAIVDDLVAAGDLRRAVRAALHLAGVYAQHGREDELLAVAERVSWLLPSPQVHWTARQAALFGLRCTALRGAARVMVLARAADYLEGSHHRPDLPFTPTAAPRQTVEWELLSRGERLRARAVAGFSKRSLRKSAAELTPAERIAISWPYEVATAIRILFDGAAAASGGP